MEDDDWQCAGEYLRCNDCQGTGGWYRCCSDDEWCEANPIKGREHVERGVIEWFTIRGPHTVDGAK